MEIDGKGDCLNAAIDKDKEKEGGYGLQPRILYFMSEDSSIFFDGLIQIFHDSTTKKLLYYWQVLQAIKRNCTPKLRPLKLELKTH